MRRFPNVAIVLGLALAMTAPVVAGKGGKGKGGGGGDDGGGDPPAPAISYNLIFPQSVTGPLLSIYRNDMNENGDVVGWAQTSPGQNDAIFCDSDAAMIFPIEFLVDPSSIPNGYRIRSAVGINNAGVVVGYLTSTISQDRIPYAVDLKCSNPKLDLLPVTGDDSIARGINDDGTILGLTRDQASGAFVSWVFDPGIYEGDPLVRASRDGLALNFQNETPAFLPSEMIGLQSSFHISNSSNNQAALVCCVGSDGVARRYALGDSSVDVLTNLVPDSITSLGITDMNDSGVICGSAFRVTGTKGKRTTGYYDGYRYAAGPDFYSDDDNASPRAINNWNEMVQENGGQVVVYRDWGDGNGERLVVVDGLVAGTNDALTKWSTLLPFHYGNQLNDSGQIAGHAWNGQGDIELFILTPVSP